MKKINIEKKIHILCYEFGIFEFSWKNYKKQLSSFYFY